MKHLLDVNVLLAAIWTLHPHNAKALAWIHGKAIGMCPISQLGFLRISTNPNGTFRVTMDQARAGLEKFIAERKPTFVPDDLPPLDSRPATSAQVTDHYLADLAEKHGLKLATFDTGLKHRAVELIR
jgi:predicted nucleic acid-binding protein